MFNSNNLRKTFYKNVINFKTNKQSKKALEKSCLQNNQKQIQWASCLIPLVTVEDKLNVLFIQQRETILRPGTLKHMAMTYPGGKFDSKFDKTTADTRVLRPKSQFLRT